MKNLNNPQCHHKYNKNTFFFCIEIFLILFFATLNYISKTNTKLVIFFDVVLIILITICSFIASAHGLFDSIFLAVLQSILSIFYGMNYIQGFVFLLILIANITIIYLSLLLIIKCFKKEQCVDKSKYNKILFYVQFVFSFVYAVLQLLYIAVCLIILLMYNYEFYIFILKTAHDICIFNVGMIFIQTILSLLQGKIKGLFELTKYNDISCTVIFGLSMLIELFCFQFHEIVFI